MAMKRFLLFLLINLPILGHTQSWSGDLDKFESSGEYWMLDGEKMTETLSLEQAYTLPAGTENWEWEFGLYFKTKPTNSNCITVYPVKGADIYFQAGKNCTGWRHPGGICAGSGAGVPGGWCVYCGS